MKSKQVSVLFNKMRDKKKSFMVIDLDKTYINLTDNTASKLGDEHLGVGFDQLLITRGNDIKLAYSNKGRLEDPIVTDITSLSMIYTGRILIQL